MFSLSSTHAATTTNTVVVITTTSPIEYEETKKPMASRVFERSPGYNQEKCGCQDQEH